MSGGREEGDITHCDSRLSVSLNAARHVGGYSLRLFVAQFLGLVGIVLYNWWVWVVVASNLLNSTDEFFSDLEANGRPDATIFQHFDLAAGIVMFVAFLIRGPWGPSASVRSGVGCSSSRPPVRSADTTPTPVRGAECRVP